MKRTQHAAGLALAAAAAPARAADIPWLHDVFIALRDTGDTMTSHIDAALTSSQVTLVVNVLFTSLALFLFVWRFVGFALRGFNLADLLELMLSIFFVYLLLTAYRGLLPATAAAARHVGDVLGKGISGATGSNSLAESLFEMVVQLSLHPACNGLIHCITGAPYAIATTFVGSMAILLLGGVATVVEIWMSWCFQAVYAIGWFAIPFLLFRKLSFIFDGWLKLFFSVLFYDIIAKVILAMVVLCFRTMQTSVPGSIGATIDVHGPYDLVALFLFIAIGVLLLLCTGRFANAMVAGVSGVGGLLQDAARGVARGAGRL